MGGFTMNERAALSTLGLSEDERANIEIRENGVSLTVSLNSVALAAAEHIYSDHDETPLATDAHSRFLMIMNKLWDDEVDRGGGALRARFNGLCEAEFFKEAATEQELRDA